MAGAQLHERQSDPEPPIAITIAQMNRAYILPMNQNPSAALFPKMMPILAMSGGGILSLRMRDKVFGTPHAKGNVPTALRIREGKGAQFRGLYPVSSISVKCESNLHTKMMSQSSPSKRVFKEFERLQEAVRSEMKKNARQQQRHPSGKWLRDT